MRDEGLGTCACGGCGGCGKEEGVAGVMDGWDGDVQIQGAS